MWGGGSGARAPDHLAGGGAARGQRGAQQEASARTAGAAAAEAEQEAGGDERPAQPQGPQEGWGWWLMEWALCESTVCCGGWGGGARSEGDDQPAQLQEPQEGWGWWLIEWWLWTLRESIIYGGG